jgi:hypothetical protein
VADDKKDQQDADLGVRDRFDDYEFNRTHGVVPTAVDAAGTERIVGPVIDNWQPAPVDPDPDEVERIAAIQEREAEARRTRLGALADPDRLGDTAQPLVDANKAEHGEKSGSSSSRSSRSSSSSSSSKES